MKAIDFRKAAGRCISGTGFILGIAVVITILGIAEGGRLVLNDSFWCKEIKVYDIELTDKGIASEEYLCPEDGKVLAEKMTEVKGSISVLGLDTHLKSYKAEGDVHTLAVNEKYQQYANLKMLKGSFIKEKDVQNTNKIVAIDDQTAFELFGTTDIIGQKLDLQVDGNKVEFVVAGVFKNFNRNIETLLDEKISGICFIPDSVPLDVSFNFNMEKLVAMVDSDLHEEEASVMLGHLLEKEHGATDIYSISEYKQLPKVSEFTDRYVLFAVIFAIAGLISGGIGVMNTMLLSIQERKTELGIQKFYGAGIKELQYDIIFRTVVICHSCGLLGLILGVLIGSFIGSFINIYVRFSLMSIFVTVAASAFVGIISSLYPASRIKLVDASETIWGE